jgi:hypothetical protein
MKTLAILVQIAALSACFSAYVSALNEVHLTGMRRAMQTIAGAGTLVPERTAARTKIAPARDLG